MNWQLFVSLRYFSAKRKERFISIISLISVLGIAVGVAALIIVISVMSGFDEDLKDRIIGIYSHVEVASEFGIKPSQELKDTVLSVGHVVSSSYFLNGQVLVRFGENVSGVVMKGIDADGEIKVSKLGDYIKSGKIDLDKNGAVIGTELADRLGAKLGDRISLVSPENPDGEDFIVKGIFASGMYEYDMNLIYVNIENAQSLLGTEGLVSGLGVKVDDVFNVSGVKKALQEKIGPPVSIRTWMELNRNLLSALKLEKTVMFIILTLIILVACFNIASALIMTVLEKTKDIGILKAIGASNMSIMAVFAIEGGIIGILGAIAGSTVGFLLCWSLKTFKFITLPKDIYYIDRLPVNIDLGDIAIILASSIILSLLAAIYPAFRASRLDPVEALRYE